MCGCSVSCDIPCVHTHTHAHMWRVYVSYFRLSRRDCQPAEPQNTSCMIHNCIALKRTVSNTFTTFSDHIPAFAAPAQTHWRMQRAPTLSHQRRSITQPGVFSTWKGICHSMLLCRCKARVDLLPSSSCPLQAVRSLRLCKYVLAGKWKVSIYFKCWWCT